MVSQVISLTLHVKGSHFVNKQFQREKFVKMSHKVQFAVLALFLIIATVNCVEKHHKTDNNSLTSFVVYDNEEDDQLEVNKTTQLKPLPGNKPASVSGGFFSPIAGFLSTLTNYVRGNNNKGIIN